MSANAFLAPATEKTVFEAINISKTVHLQHVLRDISFSLQSGEILGIYGKNASSKSTLIKALSGATSIDSGSIRLNGKACSLHSPAQASRLGITALYDDSQFIDSLSISENLFLGYYSCALGYSKPFRWKYSRIDMNKRAMDYLNAYQIPIDVDQDTATLSEAQKQTLMILRAIIRASKVLLIDDNVSMLDSSEVDNFAAFVKSAASQGIAIIFASQNPTHIRKIADSVMTISDGALSEKIPVDAFSIPQNRAADFPKIHVKKGDELFSCLSVSHENLLSDVSFSVRRGEIVGFLGASNSGRTTLARILCGAVTPDRGSLFYEGNPLSPTSFSKKNEIIMISDGIKDHGLYLKMSVRDNIALNGYQRVCYPHTHFLISHKRFVEKTSMMADSLALPDNFMDRHVSHLSFGQQRKVLFARSVFSGANLFILDEPTKGVDASGRIQIYNIINELTREGKGVIFMTSDVQEALGICDRIFVINGGRIIRTVDSHSDNAEALMEMIYEKSV